MIKYDPSLDVCRRTKSLKRRVVRPKTSNRSLGVARRLGLNRSLTPRPLTSPLALAARRIGGKSRFIELARLSTDEKVQTLVRRWGSISRSDRRYVSLDDLCEACDVAPEHLLRAVAEAAYVRDWEAGVLLVGAVFDYLRVLEAAARAARTEGGSRKRERLLVQAGII